MTSFILLLVSPMIGQQEPPLAPWEGVQKAFRNALPRPEGSMSPFETSFIFASSLLVVVLICYIIARSIQRRKEQPALKPPYHFFGRVLRELGVSGTDRMLLHLLARRSGLPEPAVLLFNRAVLVKHGRAWVHTMTLAPLRRYIHRRLDVVAEKVFLKDETSTV